MKVILDTNFLMIPGEFHIDIFEELKRIINTEYELYIFKGTITELEKLSARNTKNRPAAQVALKLIKQKNLKTLENSLKLVDDMIMSEAKKCPEKCIICTQDKQLKQRVKEQGARIITLKSKKHLDYEV